MDFKIILSPDLKYTINIITKYIASVLGWSVIEGIAIYFLWNAALVGLLTFVKTISIPQAIGLILIIKIITKVWTKDNTYGVALQSLHHLKNLNSLFYLAFIGPDKVEDSQYPAPETTPIVEEENKS